ncbi:VP4 [Yonaguni orbivirus]|nr:VP4 [Yonaguni orbivirus]
MSTSHAVLFIGKGFETQLNDTFLPVIRLNGKEDINSLWRILGKYNTDIYVTGNIHLWSIRQLRGLNFIFIGRKGQKILTRDGPAPLDIIFPSTYPRDTSAKIFEAKIGADRTGLRRRCGDLLRNWCRTFTVEFHGCEAETLMAVDPRRHRVYGLPTPPPGLGFTSSTQYPYVDDGPTDEKLVSLLDYYVYDFDCVYYVGSGDLRTLLKFRSKDVERFNRTTWYCIDPITPACSLHNVIVMPVMLINGDQLRNLRKEGEGITHALLWDVRSDKGEMTNEEWEDQAKYEDSLGSYIAMINRDWLSMACVKMRIPMRDAVFTVCTSLIVPQPMAPNTMYELRSILRLEGYSRINRDHLIGARDIEVTHEDCVKLVKNFHGITRGRRLKRALLQYLHISRVDGLNHRSPLPRVDLFYLTNKRNATNIPLVNYILSTSTLATVWIGPETQTGYDDFTYSATALMLKFCNEERMVMDLNGFLLYLMWKGCFGDDGFQQSYDPSWACKFGVCALRRGPIDLVPDVSLCRFVGLRTHSSMLRLNTDYVHKRPDVLKRLDLDVSGHLYISVVSGAYCFDLMWWIRMIKEWSSLDHYGKLYVLAQHKAETIEWKEDDADAPWHRPEDLRAALILASTLDLSGVRRRDFDRWIDMLH